VRGHGEENTLIMTETEALIALNMLPKIGPVRARRLMERCGGAAACLRAGKDLLREVNGIGEETAGIIRDWEQQTDLPGELERIRRGGYSILTDHDEAWPENFRQMPDAPLLLYVWGKVEPRDRTAIGVVGSRRATSYGLTCAKKFSFQLAHAGVTVLSGMARGIDTAAHEGAVAAKGRTIAVIGSGLGKLYPPENKALCERIAAGHGAVVSEFPVLTEPDKQTFPQRNRIVSGWSQGILVVEAPSWSGALITANNAAEQGRTVYAIPGPIDRPSSAGCNKLIQNGARLVLDASDILDDMNALLPEPLIAAADAPAGRTPLNLTETEEMIWNALGSDEAHLDQIIARTSLPAATASSQLMRMELKRLVQQLPGRRYVRLT
jgi:DNA processing protein